MILKTTWGGAAALLTISLGLQLVTAAQQTDPKSAEFFETRVRPVLAASCYDCHTEMRNGGLRVDSREALLKGGRSGPAIVPGDPDKSLLIQAVRQTTDKLKMPKGGKLTPAEVDALAEWVRAGAVWPATTATTTAAAAAYVIKPEQRAFWSFQPIRKPVVPSVNRAAWPKSDIDRFILARLERDGLAPVRAADKLTLIRRASLDLTGLPPAPEEIDEFDQDDSTEVFGK